MTPVDVVVSLSPWPAAVAASLLASAAAWRLGALSPDGALAAVAVGTTVAGAGDWMWAVLLVVFVAAASCASALPPRPQPPRRTARQVLANGSVAALAALLHPQPVAAAVFAGAVAAAWADTWATEFGVRYGGTPRTLWGWRVAAPGLSGGVTWAGTAAGVAAALCCGLAASVLGVAPAGPTAAAGVAGMLVDSLVGGTLQAQFRCTRCGRVGETAACGCGAPARPVRGLRWLDNDVTNLLATASGGGLAMCWAVWAGGVPW